MGLGLDLGFAFTNDGKSLAENRDCGFVFSCSGVVQGVLGSKKRIYPQEPEAFSNNIRSLGFRDV